jgi:hypothetical protein
MVLASQKAIAQLSAMEVLELGKQVWVYASAKIFLPLMMFATKSAAPVLPQ